MTHSLLINGVSKTIQPNWSINGRDTFNFTIISLDGSYRPTLDDTVNFTVNSDHIFSGKISNYTEEGFGNSGSTGAITITITATSNRKTVSQRRIYGSRPSETLKQRLTWLSITFFAVYGITLDPSQIDGITLEARDYDYEEGDKVLDELATLQNGAAWDVDEDLLLSVFQPVDVSAPFNIATGDGNVIGDIKITPSRLDFCNLGYLKYNASSENTDEFTAYAGQTQFNLSAIHSRNDGVLVLNGVANTAMSPQFTVEQIGTDTSLNGRFAAVYGGLETDTNWNALRPSPSGGGNTVPEAEDLYNEAVTTWGASGNWNAQRVVSPSPSGYALVSSSGLSGGDTISFTYFTVFSNVAVGINQSSIDDNNIYEEVITSDSVTTSAAAVALAQAYVDQHSFEFRQVFYETLQSGLKFGQTQTLNIPERNINTVFTITNIDISNLAGDLILYRVTLIEGSLYTNALSWKNTWKKYSGRGISSSSSVSVSSGTAGSGTRSVYLLSTGVEAVKSATPTWVPASGGAIGSGVMQVRIDTAARGSTTATVVARLQAMEAGITVQARLYDVTNSTACSGVSAVVTGTTWTAVVFVVTLTAGVNYYELQLLPGTANKLVRGSAYVE